MKIIPNNIPRLVWNRLTEMNYMTAGAVAFVCGCGVALAGQLAVTQSNLTFQPRTASAGAGTTVTWSIVSGEHTVTSDTGLFDSGTLSGGQMFSFSFLKPGTYNYHCNFHVSLGMVGTTAAAIRWPG
jgi:plastocyanin